MASDLTLGVVLGASLKSGFDGVFGKASRSVGELGKTLKATHAQLGQVQGYQRNEAALDQTRVKLGETQSKVMALKKAIALGDSSPKLAKQLQATEGKAVKLSATLDTQRTKLRAEGEALRKAGIDTRDLNSASERLTRTFESQKAALGASANLLARRHQAVAKLKGEVGKLAGLTVFGRAAIKNAVDFDGAMADVRRQVQFDKPQQFNALGHDLTALSEVLKTPRVELAKLALAGGAFHLPAGELAKFAEDATKLGLATGMSAEDAGQALGTWRAAFNLTEKEAAHLGDTITYFGRTTGASADQVSKFVADLGANGEALGFTGGQLAALGATMVGLGANTTDAMQGVKLMINTLGAGAAATDKQREALAAVGIDATKFAERMETDAAGGVMALLHRLKDMKQADRTAVLQNLFGRRGVAAIAPLINSADKLRENLRNAGDASKYVDETQKKAAERLQAADKQVQGLGVSWGNLTGIIGSKATPALGLAETGFSKVSIGAERLNKNYPRLTTVIVAATGALLTWRAALAGAELVSTFPVVAKLGSVFTTMVPGLGLAQKGVMALGGALRVLSIGTLFSPMGLAIVGIGVALVGVALLVRKYWEPIKAFFKGVWQGITDAVGPVFKSVGDSLAPLKPAFDWIGKAAKQLFGWILAPAKSATGELDKVASIGQIVGEVLGTAFKLITWPLRTNIKLIMGLGTAIGETAGWVVVHMGKAADAISGAWNGAIGFVTGLWDGLQVKIGAVIDWIMAKVQWVGDKLAPLTNLMGKVGGAERRAIGQVGGALGNMWSAATGGGPALATASGPAYAMPAPRAAGNSTVTYSTNAPITITAAPGMDERGLALEVRKQLDDRDRQQAARRRSTLGDLD